MYITNKTKQYPCTGYFPMANEVRFAGIEGLTLPIAGEIKLISEDNNLILAIQACGDYARQTYVDGVLTLTNEAEPVAPTVEELLAAARSAALVRINGKCESSIEKGVTVDGVNYPLTRGTAQEDLMRAVSRANAGDAQIPYAPHGQFATLHTPAQVLAIDKAFYERGIINRTYYGLLQAWIGTETDSAVLAAIEYGTALPTAYANLLKAQLAAVGIDTAVLTEMLT